MITYNHASIFFLIALIIPFTTSNPLSQRSLGIKISGRVCCTATGSCPNQGKICRRATGNCPSPGLSNVVVNLVCNKSGNPGGFVGVSQNLTDVYGRFEISERNVPAVKLDQKEPPCAVFVRIPNFDLDCLILSAGSSRSGSLVGIIKFHGVKRAPFGYVQEGKVPAFLRSPVN